MKQNLLSSCAADLSGKLGKTVTANEVLGSFCIRCRNYECENAKWADDPFVARMMCQEDKLTHAEQADPTLAKYKPISSMHFRELSTTWDLPSAESKPPQAIIPVSNLLVCTKPGKKGINKNTSVPRGGVMLEGDRSSQDPPSDPWDVKPKQKTVVSGAKVVLDDEGKVT